MVSGVLAQFVCFMFRRSQKSWGNLDTLVFTLAMYLSAEAVTKSTCLYIAASACAFVPCLLNRYPPVELCEKFGDLSTPPRGEGSSADKLATTHSPIPLWFDYKAASATFILSYFLHIFSAWVVFMSTLDTFHTLDVFLQIMPAHHTTTAQTFNS